MKPFGGGERAQAYAAEIEVKTRGLRAFIKSVASDSRTKDKLPIDDGGQLKGAEMGAEGLRRWTGAVADTTEIRGRSTDYDNERLEMLAYAIFSKNLDKKFIIARASRHDGDLNKVHILLLERETGALVCAFDEVGDTTGADYESKKEAVRSRNVKQNGASLRYGLRIEERAGERVVVPGEIKGIPLFYIALAKDRTEEGIREFIPDRERKSEFEKRLFDYFVLTILQQIKELELYDAQLHPDLKKRLFEFGRVLNEFRPEHIGP